MLIKGLIGVVTLLAIAFLILGLLRLQADQAIAQNWRSLQTTSTTETFTPELVADLPDPARRYFLHAIQVGTPLAAAVQLKMQGTFKLGENWLPMQADQILSVPKGLIWRAAIGQRLGQVRVVDDYVNQMGRVRAWLWGLIPFMTAQSKDTARSAIGRLAGESFWLPSALLPQRGVKWEAIDNQSAKASLTIDGESVALTLVVNAEGRLLSMMLPRWGNQTQNGEFAYIPFGGVFEEEQTFGGYTIPSKLGAGWWFGTDRYAEFFRPTIKQAIYS